jgi:sugar lactone lactonase YvrE
MKIEDAEWTRVGATTDTLGESPVWCARSQALYWVDVRAPALHRLDPVSGETKQWPMPALIGGVALAAQGELILALATGLLRFDPRTAAITPYLAPEPLELGNRLNEAKCDRQGRLWVGSMRDFGAATTGSLYRVEGAHATRVLTGITIPNGQSWSPDSATLYFADTRDGRIRAYPFDAATGEVGPMRVLVEAGALPGRQDGMTVDADGFLWTARYAGGGIARIDPDGRVERFLRLPVSQPSSVMFGGRDLDVLYVTTSRQKLADEALAKESLAGALLALRVDAKGLPETPFGA